MDGNDSGSTLPQGQRAELPVRRVTVNSIAAFNLAFFRKAAGLTQEEFGELIGWGKSVVSTAERSWDAKRVRSFSAEDLIGIAAALQIPLAALFLPPEDDGTAFRYMLDMPGSEERPAADLLAYVFAAPGGRSPVMNAYRRRLIMARVGDPDPTDNLLTEERIQKEVQQVAEEIETARGEAGQTLEAARAVMEEILGRAMRQAAQITGDARARAESLELDAQERHRQAMGSLVYNREALERNVDELRAFEREYRTGLQSYIQGQLLDLWTPELRPRMERMIEEIRKKAAEGAEPRSTALLLREDGTYDVLEFGPPDDEDVETEVEPERGEEGAKS